VFENVASTLCHSSHFHLLFVAYSSSVIRDPLLLQVGIANQPEVLKAHWATVFTLCITFVPLGMIVAGSVAFRHRVNVDGGWGGGWQDDLWAALAGHAAWLIWERFNDNDKELIQKMVEWEANRRMDYTVPYYRAKDGTIAGRQGDTKAEENAWNSNVLFLGCAMMPKHENYDKWYNKALELAISAYAHPKDVDSERRMFAYMENANLPFTPGTKYSYSNIGFTILGCVESMVEEKPFNQILQERICSKIGMLNTATRLTEEQEKIHVFGHDENGEIIRKQYTPPGDYYMLEACGGIKSNAHDMVNYLAANLGYFDTDLNAAIRESHKVHYDNNGKYPKIGLGWHIIKRNGGDVYTHGGHVGGHRSYMAFSHDSKAGVVVMINRNGNPDTLCLQLLTRLK